MNVEELKGLVMRGKYAKAFVVLDKLSDKQLGFAYHKLKEDFKVSGYSNERHQQIVVTINDLINKNQDALIEILKTLDIEEKIQQKRLITFIWSVLVLCVLGLLGIWYANLPKEPTKIAQKEPQLPKKESNDTLKKLPKVQELKRTETVNGVSFTMVKIPDANYEMMETEVTQELWKAVMGYDRSPYQCSNCPVNGVDWQMVNDFSTKLGNLTQKKYRLPTKDEWLYCAKGNKAYQYAGSDTANSVAWYKDGKINSPQYVKRKKANAFGLYDMSGNVWEWCRNGKGTALCGGSWYQGIDRCNIQQSKDAYDNFDKKETKDADLGVRLVREFEPQK